MQHPLYARLSRYGCLTRLISSKTPKPLCVALLITLGALFGCTATADTTQITPVAPLSPTSEHSEATEIIVYLMQQYHYSPVSVDDELSDQIFDRYLESLDPQRSFLLASDVKEFEPYRLKIDDALRAEKLSTIFDIFNRFKARTAQRIAYAQELLNKDFDFTIDENYTFNREEAAWPVSDKAANELWRKRVKNDVLTLRLADQSKEEISKTLSERYNRIERGVSQLTANDVFQIFINSFTLSVEPHTSYFSPRSSENFAINMSLSLEGIGAALRTENEYTVVQRVVPGGPAALSEKISAEDRIIGVGDGEDNDIVDVVSWPLNDVVDLIRGPKGSTIRLRILPAGAPEGSAPSIITLIRDKIKLEEQAAKKSVVEITSNDQSQRFGVIDLPTFYLDTTAKAQGAPDYRSTTRDVARLIDELTSTDDGVEGIIIDLRGNGGGSLTEATDLTGLFIESGPVVQIRDANGRVNAEQDENPMIAYDGPLAVLVDRYSASASEIFAAAVQDYGRGVVLGEPTFGKGTVQTVAPLDRDGKLGQLKITMAQFFRVNGDGTQHRGVIPDVLFPTAMDSEAHGERGLDNALPWAEVAAANYDLWQKRDTDYSQIRSLHESRYKASDSFTLLIDELESQRETREQRYVSLNESVREQENLKRKLDGDKRDALVRSAFGAASNDEDDDAGVGDIILEEAAYVLNDVIELLPSSKP